jgi:HK97 family phage portal protein
VWGNAFAEKHLDGTGNLIALTLLRPDLVSVDRDRNGGLVYRYSDPRGIRDWGEDEVFHVKGFGFGDVLGLSPLTYGRQTLATAMAANEAAGRTFANGMRPGGFFNYEGPQLLTAEQREQAKKVLIEPFHGAENAGKIGILEAAAGSNGKTLPCRRKTLSCFSRGGMTLSKSAR